MQANNDKSTTVIIAAYNVAATIERAILSTLAQPETVETIVVDDGSKDATADLAEQLARADARVKVIRMPVNGGPAAARNVALDAATCTWVAVLDGDDYFLPGRLSTLHSWASEGDFVSDTLIRVPENEAHPHPVSSEFQPLHALDLADFVRGNMGEGLDLGFLKPIIRRSFLLAHGLRYQEKLRLGEDYDLYGRAIAHGARFLIGGEAGYISVVRAGSITMNHSEDDLLRMRDCDDDIAAVRPLTSIERQTIRRHWVHTDCRLQWRRLISAVKSHDIAAVASTFRSPQVAGYLAVRLAEQAWLRSTGRAKRSAETTAPSS